MHTIEAENLKKTYPGGVEALQGLTFHVDEGEIFGLLGPNGAGKSTTVRILVTLSTPTSGHARVGGIDVMEDPQAVRRQLGYVSQASAVDELATGRETLVLLGRIYGLKGDALVTRVDELLDSFSLTDAAGRLVKDYSGGMKRRLDLAGGLIHRPKILFLDEPTTGLDPESRLVLWREVERLAKHEGLTILLTTHYLEEVDRLAHRLAIVDGGRVVTEGTPEDLKSSLKGDRVTVELDDPDCVERGIAILSGLDCTSSEVLREDLLLHAQVRNGARAVPAVVAALEGAGCEIAQVALVRPTLDDVYLKHTGHTFDQRDPGEPESSKGARL